MQAIQMRFLILIVIKSVETALVLIHRMEMLSVAVTLVLNY